jgi:hypothetical protein
MFLMAERCVGCDEGYVTHVLPMCLVFGVLEQQAWEEWRHHI